MLKSMKSLKGYRLHAVDGYIGDVRDIHFDSGTWEVKSIYAHTVRYLPILEVLIPRDKLGQIDWIDRSIAVNQTRKEIRHDPPITTEAPLYRRVKDKIAAYYLWAPNWTPYSGQPEPNPNEEPDETCTLRSLNHLTGYHVIARDGDAGRVDDFIVDDASWRVRMLCVNMESRIARSRPVLVPVERIGSVSFEARSVQLETELERMKEAPFFDSVKLQDRDFEESVRTFYEREFVVVEKRNE